MRTFFDQFVNDYFTFDSTFFKSVFPLLAKPGFLTLEYLSGKRVSYITPLRLYIFISIAFFLILELTNSKEASEDTDRLFAVYFPRLFFLLLPIFALILQLLNLRRKRSYVIYFLFTVHFHAFLFLLAIIYLLISELFLSLDLIVVNQVLAGLFFAYTMVYLFVSMRRVLLLKVGRTIFVFAAFLALYGSILTLGIFLTMLLFIN